MPLTSTQTSSSNNTNKNIKFNIQLIQDYSKNHTHRDMDRKLLDAAREGDVAKLHNLIKDDPFLLRAASLASGENPLHVACIGGHVGFVREILNLEPDFTVELNREGLSPLHIASARGDVEIVKEMLRIVGNYLCLVKGKEKRIPLHCAVAKGRKKVIRELLSACSDSVAEVSVRGENCLHLAVKNSQFESFKVLVEHVVMHEKEEILNRKDEQGNTILHLAAARNQYEVVDLLLDKNFGYKGKLELNLLNKSGLTPLAVLISEGDDPEINEMLTLTGALRSLPQPPPPETALDIPQESVENQTEREQRRKRPKSASKKLQHYFKYDNIRDSPSKVRNMLLVISVLIVTATYQAVLNPPGGVWQDDQPDPSGNNSTANNSTAKPPPFKPHTAGKAVLGTHDIVSYCLFLVFNSLGFYMSLHMMNFLTLGLPLQFELRVALFALIATYDTCMVAITPGTWETTFFTVLSVVMPLMMPLLTKVVRDYKKGKRCVSPSSGPSEATA